ncbi:hypothetical protein CPB97_000829 [Podila verticillata]|nr:hypothetical protein CPB97_000829 [Podila verticillata]
MGESKTDKQKTRRRTVLKQLATSLGPAWRSGTTTSSIATTTRSSVLGKRIRKTPEHFAPPVWPAFKRTQNTSPTSVASAFDSKRKTKLSPRSRQPQRQHRQNRQPRHRQRQGGEPRRTRDDQRLNDAAHASRLHAHGMCVEEFELFQYHLGKADLESYLKTRNTMLALWRDSPKTPLSLSKAFEATKDLGLVQPIIPHVYEFLLRSGYINFGMCPFQGESSDQSTEQTAPTREAQTIVVVGAGIAGVGVARQLENLFGYYADRFAPNMPPKVILLEARSRVGGRMHSMELMTKPASTNGDSINDSSKIVDIEATTLTPDPSKQMWRHAVDLGAQIITGFENGNPMEIIVRRQLEDLPLHYLDDENCDLFEHDGKLVDKTMDVHCEAVFNQVLEDACQLREHDTLPDKLTSYLGERTKTDTVGPGRVKSATLPTLGHSMDYFIESHPEFLAWTHKELGLIHWHYANLEFANATPLDQLSLRHWDQDDDYEFSGPHCMVVQGYGQVPVRLSEGLDVRLGQPVASITRAKAEDVSTTTGAKTTNESIHIECHDGTVYDCSAAIVTVPLGVLKNRQIRFTPPLPEWKETAIQHLGFGLLNKLVLVFEKPFWDTTVGLFGYVGSGEEGSFAKGYNLKAYRSSRGKFYMFWNCIVVSGLPVLVTLMAGQSAYDCENTPKDELVKEALETLRLIHPHIRLIPQPLETIVTQWSQDEYARGSYSFVGKEGTGEDYDLLAKPIDKQLYFAGEATSRHYPATAHGAYLSGVKVAKDILDSLIGPQSLTGNTSDGESRYSGTGSPTSQLQSMDDAHTNVDSPPPSSSSSSMGTLPSLGHGFVLPRRRGRVSRSMIAKFYSERSDDDSNEEDDDDEEKPKQESQTKPVKVEEVVSRPKSSPPTPVQKRGPGRPRKQETLPGSKEPMKVTSTLTATAIATSASLSEKHKTIKDDDGPVKKPKLVATNKDVNHTTTSTITASISTMITPTSTSATTTTAPKKASEATRHVSTKDKAQGATGGRQTRARYEAHYAV